MWRVILAYECTNVNMCFGPKKEKVGGCQGSRRGKVRCWFLYHNRIRARDTADLSFDLVRAAIPRRADLCPREGYRRGSDRSYRCALSWSLLGVTA
jgi:hypothetical protein